MARRTVAADTPRPNVVVIVADDLGYADVGFHGCKDIPTPNLDALAKGGTRCTNGYVSCPVCSPTRAGLLTGRYQQRFGHEFNPGNAQQADPEFGLPLSETTLADRLNKIGYATGMVGKWHLGYQPKFHPLKRGFDEFYGFYAGAHPYVNLRADAEAPIVRGTKPVDEEAYLTDAFAREAAAFIDRHREQPFFLYLTFNAVHAPLQATDKYLARFPNIADERRRKYAAMLSAMDDGVGQVIGKLTDAKLADNTLVFFVSDNGGPPQGNSSRNDPLHGAKGGVYEGGIRVPYVVRWPGHIPAGVTYDRPVFTLDILPTALAAAGVDAQQAATSAGRPLDGVNLLPYLEGKDRQPPHEALFWRFGQAHAVRKGNLKLLRMPGGGDELYDLAADISESKDLAKDRPEAVADLQKTYDAWNAQLAEPRWGPARRTNPNAAARRRARAAPAASRPQ
ncbi:MAG: sulfatase [Planctomycetia bacterium]|nr:sulfatase [Planctomycetia bacterium]